MHGLEQHAVGIAVHDAFDRAMGAVADGIGHLLGTDVELGRIGNELARDRIVWIGRIDEAGDVAGQRQRIARGDRFDPGAAFGRNKSSGDQIVGTAQRLAGWAHGEVLRHDDGVPCGNDGARCLA